MTVRANFRVDTNDPASINREMEAIASDLRALDRAAGEVANAAATSTSIASLQSQISALSQSVAQLQSPATTHHGDSHNSGSTDPVFIKEAQVAGLTADLAAKEALANKDASGGYAGLTLLKINFRNAANTFTSFFANVATAARTYTFQDRNGTIADDTDLALKEPANANIQTHIASTNNPHGTSDANLSTSDITANNVSIAKHGFAPKAPNNTAVFLDGTGAWAAPTAVPAPTSRIITTGETKVIPANSFLLIDHDLTIEAGGILDLSAAGAELWIIGPVDMATVLQAYYYTKAQVDALTTSTAGFAGEIRMYGGSSAPTGWMICNGSAISRSVYSNLYNIVGVTFGTGDGSTTFNLPDMRGRIPMGVGTGDASDATAHALADKSGTEKHLLTIGELAAHTHGYLNHNHGGLPETASGGSTAAAYASNGGATTDVNAGGASHNNIQPSLVLNFIIKT